MTTNYLGHFDDNDNESIQDQQQQQQQQHRSRRNTDTDGLRPRSMVSQNENLLHLATIHEQDRHCQEDIEDDDEDDSEGSQASYNSSKPEIVGTTNKAMTPDTTQTPNVGITQTVRGGSTLPAMGAPTPRSALLQAAEKLILNSPLTFLKAELKWQQQVAGDLTKIKAFQSEALQRSDLLAFGYMRPASPFIHILHTVGTFSLPSGDEHYRGKDIAFVGDKTEFATPTPIQLALEQPWKWITKKITLDVGPLEQFYVNPTNKNKLYQPSVRLAEQNVTLPRLLAIPPHFLEFCVTGQCTPFQFLQEITQMVTKDDSPVTI
jgi:hypothetical protein